MRTSANEVQPKIWPLVAIFSLIILAWLLTGCTSIPEDNRPRAYVAHDGNVYMTDHLNRVYVVDEIPDNAIVTFYRAPDARVYIKEKK